MKGKMFFLAIIDMVSIIFSVCLALFLHSEGHISSEMIHTLRHVIAVVIILKLFIYYLFALYSSLWEYASVEEMMKIIAAVLMANIMTVPYMYLMGLHVYFGVYLNAIMFEMFFAITLRFSYRLLRRVRNRQTVLRQRVYTRVLIIGSGATASLVDREIKNHPSTYGRVIGFIDSDRSKLGKLIGGTKVLGNYTDIYSVAKRYAIDEIIVAIPTVSKTTLKSVIDECKKCDVKVRIVPGITEIIDGKISMSKVRDVEIDDLLGREPVDLDIDSIASYLKDKTVLITGGGGSIGSELCRQIAKFHPSRMVILDIYENNAYEIQQELKAIYGKKLKFEVRIGSVRERETVFSIVEEVKPNVIFHAAAHKHVPLMEESPKEAIKNNIFGTRNIAEAAHACKVERFVMISTDKAVNPTNVMGATKRVCEMIVQGLARISTTKFVAVRFGNVLGSNGSVIPLFKKQISEGGPVTLTHIDIIRYFMTIPEAAQLVIQAGAIANGSEIFVLDMGEPVKILDLAKDLIKLSGFEPYRDIQIEITGLRPGEKLYEELLMNEEGLSATDCKKIFVGHTTHVDYTQLNKELSHLSNSLFDMDTERLKLVLKKLVPTYNYLPQDQLECASPEVLNVSELKMGKAES